MKTLELWGLALVLGVVSACTSDVTLGDGKPAGSGGGGNADGGQPEDAALADSSADSPADAYNECDTLACGAPCHPCDPTLSGCVPLDAAYHCSPHGVCTAEPVQCP